MNVRVNCSRPHFRPQGCANKPLDIPQPYRLFRLACAIDGSLQSFDRVMSVHLIKTEKFQIKVFASDNVVLERNRTNSRNTRNYTGVPDASFP